MTVIEFPTEDGCRWSVLVRDIDSGEVLLSHTPERVLSTASIGKVFLLHTLLSQVDAGERSLDERVSRLPSDLVGGSGLWQKFQQDNLSLYDLGALIGAVSDNDATNALLRTIGIEKVQQHTRDLGYVNSGLNGPIRWPIPTGLPPRLSQGNATELVDFVTRVQLGRDLSPESSDIMRKWFGASADMSMVASIFDFDGLDHDLYDCGVWLWNKTGTISTVRADIGVALSTSRRIAYAVLAEWNRGEDARGPVLETMAEIGALIGEALGWQDPRPMRAAARNATAASLPVSEAPSRDAVVAAASDPVLRDVRYLILDGDTGKTLLERKPDEPSPSASVMKTVTGVLALANLGEDYRIPTRILRGESDTEAVLVGSGDVSLSRVPTGEPTFYPKPGRLDALAEQLQANMPGLEKLLVDDSLFAASQWHPTWDEEGRSPDNYIPYISSVQVDGDRDDPLMDDSARSENPVGRVVGALGALLGDVEVSRGALAGASTEVARVESAPMGDLVREMLRSSDNALAEALARLVAIARGGDASWESVQNEVLSAVIDLGLDPSGCAFVDGSGLSEDNRLTPRFEAELVRRGYLGEGPFEQMFSRMTVSRQTMASGRFTGANRVVGGAVRAKTGYIDSVHSLAGVVTTRGGRNLVFAIFACDLDAPVQLETRVAVDSFVAALHLHGDALAG